MRDDVAAAELPAVTSLPPAAGQSWICSTQLTARVKVLQSAKPDVLEDKERQTQALSVKSVPVTRSDNQQPVDHTRLAAIDGLFSAKWLHETPLALAGLQKSAADCCCPRRAA
jgi:type VI secretion system protein VasG